MRLFFTLLLGFLTPLYAGPIQIHPENPHYFLFNGKPVVLIGSGEVYGSVVNLDFDYKAYLETMNREGQNLTRIFTGSFIEKAGAFGVTKNNLAPDASRFQPPWARSDQPGYANGGSKFDLDRWNPDYFSRLRDFVREAGRQGIIVEVVMFSSIYDEGNWSHMPFHPENNINGIHLDDYRKCHTLDNGKIFSYQEKMVREIVRELNPFDNVYFEIQNEPWPDQPHPVSRILEHLDDDVLPEPWQNDVVLASSESLEWQARIAQIIADEETGLPRKHLIAQNYCNFAYPVSAVDENISILNFHYALPECVGFNLGWNLPVSFDESGFSGPGPGVYRRQAWRFILSGGAVFNGLDYSFYTGFENGTGELVGPGGGGTELRLQLAVLRRFMETFDLPQLKPDLVSVAHHPGLFVYMLSTPGKQYAGYLEGSSAGRLAVQLPPGEYSVKWINVKTGEFLGEDELSAKSELSELETPDFEGEIAFDIRQK